MSARLGLVVASAAMVVTLGACEDEPPSDRVEGKWVLLEGTSPSGAFTGVRSYGVTLESDAHGNDGVVGGRTPCNNYGFQPSYDGGALVGDGVDRTLQGCRGAAGEVESAFFEALALVEHVDEEEDRLTLTGPDASLLFERGPVGS
ncbi:META domain-containing protein [Nocardioides bigeumensis]|uniref:DUF306 domain-containing protein n=1 Tax=Nocardioides bigeumensis TaxID=433657 RepID=A0ABP5J848_9ACTN